MGSMPPSAPTAPSLSHDSLASHVLGILSAMFVLVTLVVVARFCIHLRIARARLGAEDWCFFVGWAWAVAFDLNNIIQTNFGLGRHTYDSSTSTNTRVSLEVNKLNTYLRNSQC
ncbi:hypothetical protein N7G274_008521 [Stereocaulon virgatum]|uniref:Uncharacterized protein n=1 Tax=Stereocaulon virgatum TaxID=373712 RepID=A0ABR4A147_9LECA